MKVGTEKMLRIKYVCLHPSCQVFCRKGELLLDEDEFKELSGRTEAEDTFRSPADICRMGYAQEFRVVEVNRAFEGEEQAEKKRTADDDPLAMLTEEHQEVLKKLELIEEQVRKRDIDGLWVSTAHLENDIILHSIKKEEESLFRLIEDRIPMGPALIGIMKEDHREFISILHGFRCGLQDGEILDGPVNSLIANLRHHIKKEDEEFFTLIDDHLEDEDRKVLLNQMKELEKAHIPLDPGDRKAKGLSPFSEDRRKMDAEILAIKALTSKGDDSCCGH